MKDRIKKIRKTYRLTQVQFGERVGVKGNTVANYENGMREPSNAVISSICREYDISESWLRDGNGDMLQNSSKNDEKLSHLFGKLLSNENDEATRLKKTIIREILETDEAAWPYILEFVKNLAKSIEKKEEEQE